VTRTRRALLAAACLAALLVAVRPAGADTLEIVSTNAAYVDQAKPNNNYGSNQSLLVQGTNNKVKRALVEFVVAGLPSGVTATAVVQLYARSSNQPGTVRTQPVGAFAEATVKWSNQPPLDPTILGSVVTPSSGIFTIPAGTVAVNGAVRYGLTAPAGQTALMDFGSDEYGGGTERPRLLLSYSLPTTTSATTTTVEPTTTTEAPTTTVEPTTTTIAPTTTTLPPAPFPQGIWTSGSESGMTDPELVVIDGLGYDFVQVNPIISVLDRVNAAGLKAMIWLGNYRDDNDSGSPPCEFITPDAVLTTQINLVKDHPATFAYMIADEPHVGGCPNSPAQMAARSALIKSIDTASSPAFHPTVITENREEDFDELANTTDILGIVAYPCHVSPANCDPTSIPEHIAAAEAAGVQRYWSMPQIDGDPGANYRVATPAELETLYGWWRDNGDPAKHVGAFTFLWDGAGCCDGLANHRELDSVVLAENTGH
jgi:hypothetical protein